MKNKLFKINLILVLLELVFILSSFNISQANNSSVSIVTNKSQYNIDDEIDLTVQTDENVITASYYLNYDSSLVSFESADSSVTVKDYPNDNLVRVVYMDLASVGTKTMNFKFKVKQVTSSSTKFYLTNVTFSTINNNSYSQNNNKIEKNVSLISNITSGEDSNTSLTTPSYSYQSNNTTSSTLPKSLPQTGINEMIYVVVILILALAFFFGFKFKKLNDLF